MCNYNFSDLRGLIVGLGSIGNRHLTNAVELGVGHLSVLRRSNVHNPQFRVPNGIVEFAGIESALKVKPDFAIICNPTHLHASTAQAFLDAGCDVLIEKPLGKQIGPEERLLADSVSRVKHRCFMAYCMRFHPAYSRAKAELESGSLGRISFAKAWFEAFMPDWHPWEDYKESYASLKDQGGGVLRTLDHEIDFLNWTLGPAVHTRGVAINSRVLGIDADDVAFVSSVHASGAASNCSLAFCRKPASRGFEFIGTEATLTFSFQDGILRRTATHGNEEVLLACQDAEIQTMYVDMLQEFLSQVGTVTNENARLAPFEAGLNSLRVIQNIAPYE